MSRIAYLADRIAHIVLRMLPDYRSYPGESGSDALRYTHHERRIWGFVLCFFILHSLAEIPGRCSGIGGQAAFCISSSLPSAMEILAQVRSNLPREALFIKGQILSGGRLGKLERACYIEMFLELGEEPATVRYKISDAFGTPFEQMTISMAEGYEAEFEYESGNPLRPAAAPPPTGVIRNTDVTWNDLSLLFLWRTDGRTVREESLRGRDCYVLAFPRQEGGTKIIWIDMQMLMLIQMEDIDRDGKPQRRMSVKNIKKISDQWMIKNMEIRSYPSLHNTLIRIDVIVHGPQSTVDGPQPTVNDK